MPDMATVPSAPRAPRPLGRILDSITNVVVIGSLVLISMRLFSLESRVSDLERDAEIPSSSQRQTPYSPAYALSGIEEIPDEEDADEAAAASSEAAAASSEAAVASSEAAVASSEAAVASTEAAVASTEAAVTANKEAVTATEAARNVGPESDEEEPPR